jgi:hypothetical protein
MVFDVRLFWHQYAGCRRMASTRSLLCIWASQAALRRRQVL